MLAVRLDLRRRQVAHEDLRLGGTEANEAVDGDVFVGDSKKLILVVG